MNEIAGPGMVYVCARCGRRSKDRRGTQRIHRGWNMSCSHNAVLCKEEDLVIAPRSGIVTGMKEGARPLAN